jgi:penicillin G amidase
VTGDFDAGYRARQIRALLTKRSGWKPEELIAIQKDVYSPFLHFLAQSVANTKGVDGAVATLLRDWNGQVDKDLAAPMVVTLVYDALKQAIARRAAPQYAGPWDSTFSSSVVERLLRQRPREWFANWDAAILDAVNKALDEGRRVQGRNPAEWKYGALQALELKHPVMSNVPWLGSYFNIGPAPMSGAPSTVKQTSRTLGPSMRFVADLSDWNHSLNNLAIGQSGQILSSHYKDQWDVWYNGRSLPMHWTDVSGKVLDFQPLR